MTSNAKNPLRKEDDPRAMDQIKIGNKLVGRRFSVSSLSREFLEYRRVIAAPPHSDPRFHIGLHCPRHRLVRPRCGGDQLRPLRRRRFLLQAFSPDGNTIFFTRSAANWSAIVESHQLNGQWSHPTLTALSGEWSASSPAMSPDGSYLAFESKCPKLPLDPPQKQGAESVPGVVSNLWQVDRMGASWSKPTRLPDTVNLVGQSLWKSSSAAD
jgi:hypothetical protein